VAGVLLSSEDLQRLCLDLLRALRTPQDLAQVVAGALHAANLAGHDSHGVIRMPDYAQRVREGKIDPEARAEVVRRRGAGACVSARRGWGQPGARLAAQTAAEIAGELGVGAVVLQESPHVGRLADYVELIAGSGRIGMAVTNAWVRVAPFGGRDRRLGTDPIAFGIPTAGAERPIVVDFATSVVAEGKLKVALASGAAAPPGRSSIPTAGPPMTPPTSTPEDRCCRRRVTRGTGWRWRSRRWAGRSRAWARR
jgi:uncharacterized oxidoreductase